MSEAELTENGLMAWSNFVTVFGLGISIISGYLIVAYSVGATLSRSQVIFINVMFVGTMATVLLGMYGFRALAADLDGVAFSMTTQRTFAPISWAAFGTIGFTAICVLGALKFMSDIRHPKTK